MTPLLHPVLVNDRFSDPALYVDFRFEKRALIFDLGDLHALPARKILRLSDIFVSHTHMDHFAGFDRIVRLLLGRDRHLRLTGPEGFIDNVRHRLASYTWNLSERFATDLVLTVTEVHPGDGGRAARLSLKRGFRAEPLPAPAIREGVVAREDMFEVRAAILDHRTPCLAFAVAERAHVNVWKNRLAALGLPVGPWLRELKQAVFDGRPDDAPIRIRWRETEGPRERTMALGELKREVLEIGPGQKLAYVTDASFSEANQARIVALAKDADLLFIEAAFAQEDSALAAERCHLTTAQAGELARRAGVRRVEPFHFSPRYEGEGERLEREVREAFAQAG